MILKTKPSHQNLSSFSKHRVFLGNFMFIKLCIHTMCIQFLNMFFSEIVLEPKPLDTGGLSVHSHRSKSNYSCNLHVGNCNYVF